MKEASAQKIASILSDYSVPTEEGLALAETIRQYIVLLLRWNQSLALTTITYPEEIVRFHFGESLFAASVYGITSGRLADVGSGAGFPGLPLKMAAPVIDLTLIESNAKKAAFLSEIIRRLSLQTAAVFRGRMDEFDRASAGLRFDFIAARALGQFAELLAWSKSHLTTSGKIILWVGEEEAKTLARVPEWNWSTPVHIPRSRRRFIVSGSMSVPRGTELSS